MTYNYNMANEVNEKYSWDPKKRELNLHERGLDFVPLADEILSDPNVVIEIDPKPNTAGEERFLAFGLVNGNRLCLCFTPRGDKLHLITIFKVNKRIWRKHYEKDS